jgi:hypothetical protein
MEPSLPDQRRQAKKVVAVPRRDWQRERLPIELSGIVIGNYDCWRMRWPIQIGFLPTFWVLNLLLLLRRTSWKEMVLPPYEYKVCCK